MSALAKFDTFGKRYAGAPVRATKPSKSVCGGEKRSGDQERFSEKSGSIEISTMTGRSGIPDQARRLLQEISFKAFSYACFLSVNMRTLPKPITGVFGGAPLIINLTSRAWSCGLQSVKTVEVEASPYCGGAVSEWSGSDQNKTRKATRNSSRAMVRRTQWMPPPKATLTGLQV
jgi:hypothetical protein